MTTDGILRLPAEEGFVRFLCCKVTFSLFHNVLSGRKPPCIATLKQRRILSSTSWMKEYQHYFEFCMRDGLFSIYLTMLYINMDS